MALDFDAINAAALAALDALLRDAYPNGRAEGGEYLIGDWRGSPGKSCRINIAKGQGKDFASGEAAGDPIGIWALACHGGDRVAAARDLAGRFGLDGATPAAPAKGARKGAKDRPATCCLPVPDDAPKPPLHPRWGKPVRAWVYRDAAGKRIGGVCRFEPAAGKKEIVPLTCWRDDETGRLSWRWKQWPVPRPLYGLDRLAARPEAPVIMCEGEKDTDAAGWMLPDWVAVCWPGGGQASGKVDWRALDGRKVLYWPDADAQRYPEDHPAGGLIKDWHEQPGYKAALAIQAAIGSRCSLVVISPPMPDPARDGWGADDLLQALRAKHGGDDAAVRTAARAWVAAKFRDAKDRGPLRLPADEALEGPPPAETPPPPIDRLPFTPLGYDDGRYFFYSTSSRQLHNFAARDFKRNELIALAPLAFWEANYPGREGPAWGVITDHLIRMCESRGVYDNSVARGRGAWRDGARVVLHLGNRLRVDGQDMDLSDIDSRFAYQAAPAMDVVMDRAATDAEARAVLRVCLEPRWQHGISGILMAGFAVVAPLGGVLPWRPHVWITGPSQSGKTTVFRDILGGLISPLSRVFEGVVTEAGIRGKLRSDALPVILDEAEGEDSVARARMQAVLNLCRVAASESGGEIVKGRRDGGSVSYKIRSCFAFAAINPAMTQTADESRVTLLALAPPPPTEDAEAVASAAAHYDELRRAIAEAITPETPGRLLLRTLENLESLLANCTTFTLAVARHLGNRRAGDHLGPLLAGAYLLRHTDRITPDAALKFVQGHEWAAHTEASEVTDETKLFERLMQERVRISSDNRGTLDLTIAELVDAAIYDNGQVTAETARDELFRCGLRPAPPGSCAAGGQVAGIIVANRHRWLADRLRETQWATTWRRALASIPGAVANVAARFGSGRASPPMKGVWVPLPENDE